MSIGMPFKPLVATLALAAALPAQANIDIVFDYSYDSLGFFNDPLRRNLMDSAAGVFEGRLTDTLSAITPGGVDYFDIVFYNPASGSLEWRNDFSLAQNRLVIFAGGASLGGGTLGEGGPGGFDVGGNQAFVDNALTRGQAGATDNPATSTDFGPWGGSISFDRDSNWHFDTNGVGTQENFAGQYDFYSVALHEIAHVLGYGTAESWDHRVSGSVFDGPASGSVSLHGDGAHWADGTRSGIDGAGSFATAMSPYLSANTRKPFTDLDFNGLRDIGWQVAAVPEPESWAMLLAGLGLLGVKLRRRIGA